MQQGILRGQGEQQQRQQAQTRPSQAPRDCRFKSAVLKLPHLNQVSPDLASKSNAFHHDHNTNHKRQEEESDRDDEASLAPRWTLEARMAFQDRLSGEKHHHQNLKLQNGKNGKKKDRYGYQYDRYGKQTQQVQPQRSQRERKGRGGHVLRLDEINENDVATTALDDVPQPKRRKDYKRVSDHFVAQNYHANDVKSGKMKMRDEPQQPQPLLVPKGRSGSSSNDVNARKKHMNLVGADLYVTRLGWNRGGPSKGTAPVASKTASTPVTTADAPDDDEDNTLSRSTTSVESIASSSSTGSLHDELVNREPKPEAPATLISDHRLDLDCVHASRPCYRCISYMHAVGIKRVFWTNDAGQWEGGKVRDLVDALDNSMESVADGGPLGNGVFVTKHEVLMLKRMMGQEKG